MQKMNGKTDVSNFKGGFIPDEVKTLEPQVRKDEETSNWQESSDREESLSDPRWHKRPPTTRKQNQQTPPLHNQRKPSRTAFLEAIDNQFSENHIQ